MIVTVIAVVAVAGFIYEYRTKATFKAAVLADVSAAQSEVAALRTKAASTVSIVDSDFAKAESLFLSLAKKF